MDITGNLIKMKTSLDEKVNYFLTLEQQPIHVNDLIGHVIEMEYHHQINCIKCGRKTSKSFGQGFCFPCFRSAPEASECILKPELCQAHLGISRDMEWSKSHCLIDHYVYLSYTSGVKVGVTRENQIPVRWCDQGAVEALPVARTPNRHLAGLMEVALKEGINDKTNWRRMLTDVKTQGNELFGYKDKILDNLPADLKQYFLNDAEMTSLTYPVRQYPLKIKSFTFDKIDRFKGTLLGIKGQYFIFDQDMVINIRKHNGYLITLKA